jgi:hypothetical protein
VFFGFDDLNRASSEAVGPAAATHIQQTTHTAPGAV